MRYHNITKDDMLNGDGLRVVLWLSGCEHHCKSCQNPITWDPDGGLLFNMEAKKEIFAELEKDYIDGITLSGGDPLHSRNVFDVLSLVKEIRQKYPEKTIWVYTGYTWEELACTLPSRVLTNHDRLCLTRLDILELIDVLVDGKFVEELKDVAYPWAGSTNQRVIDVKKSLELNCAIKWRVE